MQLWLWVRLAVLLCDASSIHFDSCSCEGQMGLITQAGSAEYADIPDVTPVTEEGGGDDATCTPPLRGKKLLSSLYTHHSTMSAGTVLLAGSLIAFAESMITGSVVATLPTLLHGQGERTYHWWSWDAWKEVAIIAPLLSL